ncbi:hypothetical protein GCM10028864_20660 [Microlunatus parietis]
MSEVMRRRLRAQPVLRLRELWNPGDPDSGAGQALGRVFEEMARQGLTQAGTVSICTWPATEAGLIPGEAAVPVDRPGRSAGEVEALTLPAGTALSILYRDDIHLTSSEPVVDQLRTYADAQGLALTDAPRWIYHTAPDWNLEPDDHLIEALWPIRDEE